MTNESAYVRKIIIGSSLPFNILPVTPQTHAQKSVDAIIHDSGTGRQEVIDLPKSMTYPVDSLLNDWKVRNYIDLKKDYGTSIVNLELSDSIHIGRLSRMPTVVEMPYNETVRKFIDMYTGCLCSQAAPTLSTCSLYMPVFEEALNTCNLPLELKYLPITEPALNPSAVSYADVPGL